MSRVEKVPRWLWRLMRVPPQIMYAIGLGPLIGRTILLLTTKGRKTGKPRVTPLQYDLLDNCYYVGAARGLKTDWVQNIQANPEVEVRVAGDRFTADAEVVTNPARIADFMIHRYQKRPGFMRTILQVEGFTGELSHETFMAYATKRVLIILNPTTHQH